jgi:hypothetical protein
VDHFNIISMNAIHMNYHQANRQPYLTKSLIMILGLRITCIHTEVKTIQIIIVLWLETLLFPARGNFADLTSLKVHCLRNILSVVCTLAVGAFSRNKDLK